MSATANGRQIAEKLGLTEIPKVVVAARGNRTAGWNADEDERVKGALDAFEGHAVVVRLTLGLAGQRRPKGRSAS